MASRRKPTEAAGKGDARAGSKPAARTPANKKAPAKSSAAPTAKVTGAGDEDNGAKGLIHAGLKALGTVRDDVVMRQSSMIDSLLGIGGAKAADRTDASAGVLPRSLKSLDPFGGLRKFEDVFDLQYQ